MDELKVHFQIVMLWECRIKEMLQKQLRKLLEFIVNVFLLTVKSETHFQSFILIICHWEINPEQDAYLILIWLGFMAYQPL